MGRKKKITCITVLVVLVGGFLGFVVGGFWGVPWVTQSYVLPGISSNLNGELRAKKVSCNPFYLRLKMEGIELVDTDDKPVVTVDHLLANMNVSSVWQFQLNLQKLYIDRPKLTIDIKPSGESNVAEVLDPALDLWADLLRSPRISIDDARVIDAQATYVDHSLGEKFEHTIEDLNFELVDFSTRPDQKNPYSFVATTGAGERLEWKGRVTFNPLETTGDFKLIGINLAKYFPYVRAYLNSRLQSGVFDVNGSYHIAPVAEPKVVELNLELIDVRDVAVAPMDTDAPYAQLDSLTIRDVLADVANHRIEVGSIDLQDADANVNRLANGNIDVVAWLMPNLALGRDEAAATATPTAATGPRQTSDGRDVLPPHLAEARQRLQVALEGLIEAAKSTWALSVGPIRWQSFDVTAVDQTLQTPVRFAVTKFELTTEPTGSKQNFVTPFKATMTLNDSTPVKLSGKLDPFKQNATIQVDVDKLAISPAQSYLSGILDAVILGDLSLDGEASMGLVDKDIGVQLTYDGEVQLEDFSVTKTGEPEPRLAWKLTDINKVLLNLTERSVKVDVLTVKDLAVATGLSADGKLDVFELLRDPSLVDKMAEQAAASSAGKPANAPISLPLKLKVNKFQLESGGVKLADRTTTPTTELAVSNLNVGLENLVSVDEDQPLENTAWTNLTANMNLNETGTLAVQGKLKPFHKNADIQIDMKNFNIAAANPHVIRYANAEVAGLLSVVGPASLTQDSEGDYIAAFNGGDIELADLIVKVPGEADPRLTTHRIDLSHVNFEQKPLKAHVDVISILKPVTQVTLKQDGQIDLLDLLKDSGKQDAGGDASQTAAAGDMQLPQGVEVAVDEVRLAEGDITVTDARVTPNFQTSITDLKFTGKNISLTPDQVTTYEAAGKVASSAPFELAGSAELLKPFANTAAKLSLEDFPAKAIDVYLVEYTAHPAESGRIDVLLDSKVSDQQLSGDLTLLLDDFYLGKKVENPGENAIDLPIKLGMDILRNNQKEINLKNIPLTGDLSKPGVEVSGLIADALGNFIKKIISAPFDMLAQIAGEGDGAGDLKYITFEPGSDKLAEDQAKKLDVLAKVMKDRPALKLGIKGFVVEADTPALQKAEIVSRIQEQVAITKDTSNGISIDPVMINVTDAEYRRYIRTTFNTMFPPAQPAEAATPGAAADVSATGTQPATTPPPAATSTPNVPFDEIEQAVLSTIDVTEIQKQTLAGKRARLVQLELVDNQSIAPDRVTVDMAAATNTSEPEQDGEADTDEAASKDSDNAGDKAKDEQGKIADKPRVEFSLK